MNLQQIRNETPGCKERVHFNNAGASLMPTPVVDAIQKHIALEAQMGGYEAAEKMSDEVAGFYSAAARLLNCKASQIAYTSSATSAFDRALTSIPFQKGDKILLANEDYVSNQLAFLSLQRRFGVELVRARSLAEGGVDVNDMVRLMKAHRPKLVTLTHVPTNSGLVQPVAAVGKHCKELGLTYLVDACQSVGQMPVNVQELHCDFLSGTFRKFLRGPRGSGFLYVSDKVIEKGWEPLFVDMRGADWKSSDHYDLHPSARRFEEWEAPYALLLGAKASIEYAMKLGLGNIEKANQQIATSVRQSLAGLGLELLDKGATLSSIITVRIPGKDAHETLHFLRNRRVNTSVSARSSAVIDFDTKGVDWALRVSPHYFNTSEEIDILAEVLKEWMKRP